MTSNPRTPRTPHTAQTAHTAHAVITLAELVARDGIDRHHEALVAAVRDTHLARSFPLLAEVTLDATAPPVARERALGRLAAVAATPVRAPSPVTVWRPHAA